jgi:K+-sensing histidine kinase KdpD
MKPEEIKEYRKQKRAKAEKILDTYVQMAKAVTFQVVCAKVIIKTDDVAEGLEELISLNNVTEFVMGAAADRHFSRYGSN